MTGLILQNQAQLGLPKAQGPEEDAFHQEHEAIRYQEQQVPCWHPSTSTWAQYHGSALGVWREESSPSVLSTEPRGAWDKSKHPRQTLWQMGPDAPQGLAFPGGACPESLMLVRRIVLICARRSLCAAFSVLPYGEGQRIR